MPASPTTTPIQRVGALLALTGFAGILTATLFPNPSHNPDPAATPLLCLVCGEGGGADVFLNLLLFAPMAVGLRLAGWSWRRVVAAAALLSLTVEVLQFAVIDGRDSSLSDVLSNSTGAAVAAALAPYLPQVVTPAPALARRLLLGAAALFVAVLSVFAIGYQPSIRPGRLTSDCSQDSFSATVAIWTGTLRSVVFEGDTLPCDEFLSDSAVIRAALLAGNETIRVEGFSGDVTRGRALVHTIRAAWEPALTLSQDGNSAVFSVPTGTQRLRLPQLSLQLPRAFPLQAGIPLQLQAGQDGRRIWIASTYSGRRRYTEVTVSPSFGWNILVWRRLRPGRDLRVLTAIWLGMLMIPVGYWAGFVRPPALGPAVAVAALAAGLGWLPSVTGYPPAHWSEWLGGALGAALGWAVHWLAAYLQSRCGSPSINGYSSP